MDNQAFMTWNGRRVEWQMLHPEFKKLWGFLIHGSEACAALEVHPMFPTTPEIAAVAAYLAAREPKF